MSTRLDDFRIEDWLPAGVSPDDLIAMLAGGAAFVLTLALLLALRADGSFERRLTAITDRRDALRQAEITRNRARKQGNATALSVHRIVSQLNLLRGMEATNARRLLARAGIRAPEAVGTFLFCKLSLPLLFGTLAMINGYLVPIVPVPDALNGVVGIGAVLLGYIAPKTYLNNRATKRRALLQKALPDGLDLLVICVEAGLSLDAAFARVARELGTSFAELAEEFGITAAELTFLPDRRQALDNLNQRTDLPALRGVVNTLQQAEKFGTPLAVSLRVLSAEFRDTRMMKAEEKAARLPVMLTVPMMLFILPVLFVVLMGPAILSVLDQFK